MRLLGDINGDGRADIVGFGAEKTLSALGKADGTFEPWKDAISEFSQKQGWSNSTPRSLGDVNGDGWADIVGFGINEIIVGLSNGDGTFRVENKTIVPSRPSSFTIKDGWPNNNTHPRQVTDVNGDGLADIVGFGGGGVVVALANDVGGSDRLLGGDGNDTLVGGVGTKEATGGSGSDRFVLNTQGLMTIKDFTRDNDLTDGDQGDKIDIGGLQTQVDDEGARLLSFKFLNGNTQIKAGTETIANVEGIRLDSRDLLQSKSLKTLTADEVKDINKLVQKWAEGYAGAVGDQVGGIDTSRVKFTAGEITYKNNTVVPVDNIATSEGVFRNNSTAPQSTTFTFADQTNWSGSYQFSTAWKVGAKIGSKIGYKTTGDLGIAKAETSVEVNLEVTAEGGQTKSWTDQEGGSRLNQTAITTSAPANAVTIVKAVISGEKFDSPFTLPIFIEGTVDIDLANGEANDIKALPIGAILQYYNPVQFQPKDPNNVGYYDLPNGEYLSYGNATKAIVTGQAKQADLLTANVTVESIFDQNLSNPAANPEVSGNLNNKDRFWLALDGLPAKNPPVKITNFSLSQDKIGIVDPSIDGKDDLTLGSRVVNGITVGTISYGSRVLAELSGIDATKLTTNNFLFSTTGSIFDNSLLPAAGNHQDIVQTPL